MLVFGPVDYAVAQAVSVAAEQDADAADEIVMITLASPGSADAFVGVSVQDDEVQSVVVSRTSLQIREGTTATFIATFRYDPGRAVTLSAATSNAAVATITPAGFTLGPVSWGSGSMITVTGVEDADFVDGVASVTVSSPGLNPRTVDVEVDDDETVELGVTVSGPGSVTSNPAGVACGNNCSAGFEHNTTVTLSAAPGADAVFDGWAGDCTGPSCVVTMSEARNVLHPQSPSDGPCDRDVAFGTNHSRRSDLPDRNTFQRP